MFREFASRASKLAEGATSFLEELGGDGGGGGVGAAQSEQVRGGAGNTQPAFGEHGRLFGDSAARAVRFGRCSS